MESRVGSIYPCELNENFGSKFPSKMTFYSWCRHVERANRRQACSAKAVPKNVWKYNGFFEKIGLVAEKAKEVKFGMHVTIVNIF